MVWPRTNWRPISRIARVTAVRITGSPRRRTAPRRVPARPGLLSSSTRPVSISAQVEALTRLEELSPRWRPQSEGAILSSISASMVARSGTRSIASARHIRATPSRVDRPYSASISSIIVGLDSARMRRIRLAARSLIRARVSGDSAASRTSRSSRGASGWNLAEKERSVMAAPLSDIGRISRAVWTMGPMMGRIAAISSNHGA